MHNWTLKFISTPSPRGCKRRGVVYRCIREDVTKTMSAAAAGKQLLCSPDSTKYNARQRAPYALGGVGGIEAIQKQWGISDAATESKGVENLR